MLKNSDGNYAIVKDANKSSVTVEIFRTKTNCVSGVNPFFEHSTQSVFNVGEDLNQALINTTGDSGMTVSEQIIVIAEDLIVAQALVDPNRHVVSRYIDEGQTIQIKGDWEKVAV